MISGGQISPEALDILDEASHTPLGYAQQTIPPSNIPSRPAALPFIHTIMDAPPSTPPPPDDKYDSTLEDNLQDISLGCANRFFGKSSEVMLHRATLRLKHNYLSDSPSTFVPESLPCSVSKGGCYPVSYGNNVCLKAPFISGSGSDSDFIRFSRRRPSAVPRRALLHPHEHLLSLVSSTNVQQVHWRKFTSFQ
jgi:hypothetical protein